MSTHIDEVLADLMRRLLMQSEGVSVEWHQSLNERPRTSVTFPQVSLTLTDLELRAIQSERARSYAESIAELQRHQEARGIQWTEIGTLAPDSIHWSRPEPILSPEQAEYLRTHLPPRTVHTRATEDGRVDVVNEVNHDGE